MGDTNKNRSCMNNGRASRISLMVLVDLEHRELSIDADIIEKLYQQ